MKISRPRKIQVLSISLLVFIGLGYVLLHHVMPYIGIKPMRMNPAENTWRFPQGYTPEAFQLQAEKCQFVSPDGLHMSAWLVHSRLDTTYGAFVLLHGISACKEINFGRAAMLADCGYASLLPDLRAHGESEGEYCTFGFCEKNDMKAAADTLLAHFPNIKNLGIWGASLGGAVALQTMGDDARFNIGIIESTFDEFPKVAAEYGADYMLGLRSDWIVHQVIERSGEIAGFNPFEVMPVRSAANIHAPVLFMHGDKDARIPIEFNKRNFEALPYPLKKWVTVPNAGHSNLWSKDPVALQKELVSFIKAAQAEHQ